MVKSKIVAAVLATALSPQLAHADGFIQNLLSSFGFGKSSAATAPTSGGTAGTKQALAQMAPPSAATDPCHQAQTAAANAYNTNVQNQVSNMQNQVQQPGDLASQTCLGNILNSKLGIYLQAPDLGNLLSSLANQFATMACNAATSQWNQATMGINQAANLPLNVGGANVNLGHAATTINQGTGSAPVNINTAPPTQPQSGSGTGTTILNSLKNLL